jgi:hypothetical protein
MNKNPLYFSYKNPLICIQKTLAAIKALAPHSRSKQFSIRLAKMKFIVSIFAIFCIIVAVQSACPPWKSGGTINVCKNRGKSNCIGVSSTNTCINLVGGPFVSGFSSSAACTIYSGLGCSGTSISVDRSGWANFPITPKSVRCPCV